MISKYAPKGSFVRSVLMLMTGTSIAQAIPVAISPILTRIYSPADFGLFAIYAALASVLGIIATGRYEVAIMLPREDEDAEYILILSLLISVSLACVLLIIATIFGTKISELLGNPKIRNWLYLLPVSILLTGTYQSLSYWANRRRRYSHLAKSRIIQGSVNGATQVGVGNFIKMGGGMIVGSVVGSLAGVLSLGLMTNLTTFRQYREFSRRRLFQLAIKYKKYPLLSSCGALLDGVAVQVPVLFVAKLFGAATTGLFSMTFKIINMPMTLISNSIGQVLYQRISTIYNDDPKKLRNFVLKILALLVLIAAPMIIIMSIYGPTLFGFVFGEHWRLAGHYASILSIAVAVRFIVSPLSSVMILEHNVSRGVIWQIGYSITIVVTLLLASSQNIEIFLKIFVAHEVIQYGIYLILIICNTRAVNEFTA